jgi:hypothetical protein
MTKVTQKQVTWQLKNNDENKSKLHKKKNTKSKTRINENHFGYLPRRKVYP